MRVYELNIDALNPTNQTLELPSDSTIGFSVNISDIECSVFGINVVDSKNRPIKIEGYLTDTNKIPYFVINTKQENTEEYLTVKYSTKQNDNLTCMSFSILIKSVSSGVSYKTNKSNFLEKEIKIIDKRVDRVENKVAEIEKTGGGSKEDLARIETKIDSISTEVDSMSTEMSTVTNQMTVVSEEMVKTTSAIGVIPEKIDTMDNTLKTLYVPKAVMDEQNVQIKQQLDEI